MIYKYNDELPPDIVEKYNAAISEFIKTYPSRVQVSMQENDNVVISLLYGYERGNISSILREIATRCRGSLIDDVFRMDIPSCRIVYANTSIIRFAGDLNAILEDIPTLSDKLEVYKKPIVSKLPSEVNLPNSFNADVDTIVSIGETLKTQNISISKQESMGITTQIIGNKEHVIINPKTVEKYANSHANDEIGTSLNDVVQTIVETLTNSPSITTTKITKKLESAGLILERLNKDVIMIGKVIEKPEDKEQSETGADEMENNDSPKPSNNKYSDIRFHYGNPVITDVDPNQYEIKLVDDPELVITAINDEDGQDHVIEIPYFILWNKKDDTYVALDYAFRWLCPEEYVNDEYWWFAISVNKFIGNDGNEYEDTPYNRIIHNPNIEERSNSFNLAKQKYLNYSLSHMKNITTDHVITIPHPDTERDIRATYEPISFVINRDIKTLLNKNPSQSTTSLMNYLKECAIAQYPDDANEISNMSDSDFLDNVYPIEKASVGYYGSISSRFFDIEQDTVVGFSDKSTVWSQTENDEFNRAQIHRRKSTAGHVFIVGECDISFAYRGQGIEKISSTLKYYFNKYRNKKAFINKYSTETHWQSMFIDRSRYEMEAALYYTVTRKQPVDVYFLK